MYPHETTKSVTFVVTNACNFSCSYCYLPHKTVGKVMPLSVAKKAVDYILSERTLFTEDRVGWDFIGGEPLLEVNLIGDIIYYIIRQCYERNHPWFQNSLFGITTNGHAYFKPGVQKLIRSLGPRLGLSITLDGTEDAHNACRKTLAGKGTYKAVRSSVDVHLARYPDTSTKVTITHETLPRVAESILHLFEIGFRKVHANVVFENVWVDGDDALFEQQLIELGNAIIDRGYYRSHSCSLFTRNIGKPLPRTENNNWCGAGRMLAIDWDGFYYPCNRFTPFSLANAPPRAVGHVDSGIDPNLLRPFLALTRSSQSPADCMSCAVATGCAWCQGLNYDETDGKTIYKRATNLCKMHHARVRANERFWARQDGLVSDEKNSLPYRSS